MRKRHTVDISMILFSRSVGNWPPGKNRITPTYLVHEHWRCTHGWHAH